MIEWLKRYWPVLGLLVLGGATVGVAAAWSRRRAVGPATTLGWSRPEHRAAALDRAEHAVALAERGKRTYDCLEAMQIVRRAEGNVGAAIANADAAGMAIPDSKVGKALSDVQRLNNWVISRCTKKV